MKFETIYDIINYIEKKYPQLVEYSSDSFFTAYRIPVTVWKCHVVDIPIYKIKNINQQLTQGRISVGIGTVFLSYE